MDSKPWMPAECVLVMCTVLDCGAMRCFVQEYDSWSLDIVIAVNAVLLMT